MPIWRIALVPLIIAATLFCVDVWAPGRGLLPKWRVISWMASLTRAPIESTPISQMRESFNRADGAAFLIRNETVLSVDTVVAGVSVRRFWPQGALPGIVVYYHGGGWILGDPRVTIYDSFGRYAASLLGRELVSVDYRLAPEAPFPAAFNDSVAVARALLRELAADGGIGKLVVMGDSAGGNLAAAVSNALADEAAATGSGSAAVAAQVLIYPVTDCQVGSDVESDSHVRFASGYMLTAAAMRYYRAAYAQGAAERADPRCSVLLAADATLARAPPAYVLLAGCDVLHDEGLAYAARLAGAGGLAAAVAVDDVAGVMHGFSALSAVTEAADAHARLVAWLASRW